MALAGLALALALAAALRLQALGTWSLWADEMATAAFASLTWQDLSGPLTRLETTPPTYYVLIKAWTTVVGAGDAALRLPSVLAGIATVAALWRLCRDSFGYRAAFWAAMILAVTGWHLFHSRDARVYAVLTLVIVLGLLAGRAFVARVTRAGAGWGLPALVMAALGAAAAWLHFTGVIVAAMIFGHAAVLMVARGTFDRHAASRLIAASALSLLLTLPIVLLAWTIATSGSDSVVWMRRIGLGDAGVSMVRVLLLAPWTVDPWHWIGPACAGVAALVCVLLAWQAAWPGPRAAERTALLATLLGGIALFLLIHWIEPVVLPRTLQVLVPLVAALLGVGLARLRPALLRPLVFAVFLASQVPSLHDTVRAPPDGSDWRGLTGRLATEGAAGGTVIALDVFDALALDRYRAPDGPEATLVMVPSAQSSIQQFVAARLSSARMVAPADLGAALCDDPALRDRVVFVVERVSPVLDEQRRLLEPALRQAGAHPGPMTENRRLRLRSFTRPICMAEPSAAPL